MELIKQIEINIDYILKLIKKYHEPKSVKDVKNLYMAFAEIEVEFETLEHFFAIIMGYMPSNVEIFEPEKFKINSSELNSLSNYIVAKLHNYDNIAKRLISERDVLLNQMQYIKEGGKIEDLIKEMKIPTIIVTRSKVGTVNHTIMTVKMCEKYKIPIIGIIINDFDKGYPIKDLTKDLQNLTGIPVLGSIPFINDMSDASLTRIFKKNLNLKLLMK